jgi:hypothetical protein
VLDPVGGRRVRVNEAFARPPWRRRTGLLPCREGCKAMLRRHFSNWRGHDALVVHFSVNREDQLGVE